MPYNKTSIRNIRAGTLLRWYALKKILNLKIKKGSLILDIGGYDGFISFKLHENKSDIKIVVVDIDRNGLEIALERGLNSFNTSALNLPFKDDSFDFVLCLDLIEHIEKDIELIGEITRVLKYNGYVILTTPTEKGISFPFLSKIKNDAINYGYGHVRKGYSFDKLKKLFLINDLIVVDTKKYYNFLSRLAYQINSI